MLLLRQLDDDDDDDDHDDGDDGGGRGGSGGHGDVCCTDGSRSSPSLASIPAKVVRSVDSRSQQRHIVVVADGQPSGPVVDADTQRLSSVPAFTPLLHGSMSLSDDRPPQLDAQHVLALCSRYQDHLHQSAEAVAFDQNALCVRIKEVSQFVML